MEKYTLVKDGQKYGINKGEANVLPCKYDAIWKFNESLLGLREDDFYGLFSLKKGKVVLRTELFGKYTLYSQHTGQENEPRYISSHGIHSKQEVFIESVCHILNEENKVTGVGENGVVYIFDDGRVEHQELDMDEFIKVSFELNNISIVETKDEQLVIHRGGALNFFSDKDEELYNSNCPIVQALTHINFNKYVNETLEEQGVDRFDYFNDPELPKFREFNYEAIPVSIIRACEKHLDFFYEVEPASEFLTKNLIYLAWLFANDYVVVFEDGLHMVEGRYEYEDVDGQDGARSLDVIRSEYNLDKIIPFLKVSSITDDYLPVLININ